MGYPAIMELLLHYGADPAAATEFPNELRTTPPRVSRSATVVESGTASANVAPAFTAMPPPPFVSPT
mgnify:CR=1 FL=1